MITNTIGLDLYADAYFVMHVQWADTQFLLSLPLLTTCTLRVGVSTRNKQLLQGVESQKGQLFAQGSTIDCSLSTRTNPTVSKTVCCFLECTLQAFMIMKYPKMGQ